MLLTEVTIKNFLGIEELSLSLDDFSVLVGDNNTEKSSILDAIRIYLTYFPTRWRSAFEEYDYYSKDSSAEPNESEPIEVTLKFAEIRENEWLDEVSKLLPDVEQFDENNLRSVPLRVTSCFDPATGDFVTD